MDETKDILKKLLGYLNKNPNSLAKDLGYKRAQRIYDIEDGTTQKFSPEVADDIVKKYPDINRSWLLTGEGFMLKTPDSTLLNGDDMQTQADKSIRQPKINSEPYMVPCVDLPAQAGYRTAYSNIDYILTLKKFPILPNVDPHAAVWRYFEVAGDSMEPVLSNGDTVLASLVLQEDWADIRDKYTYVIVTHSDLLIKDIQKESETQWILLSQNEEYEERLLNVSDVRQLWVARRRVQNKFPKSRRYDIDEIRKKLKLT